MFCFKLNYLLKPDSPEAWVWNPEGPGISQQVIDDKLTIEIATPGYPQASLRVSASGDKLEVKGLKSENYSAFAEKDWQGTFTDKHAHWNFAEAQVKYKHGVLTIEIPRRREKSSKLLPISEA
jgi:HSP20 family molecular chaperone IbpA